MHSIERTDYGFKLTLAGRMNAEQIGDWLKHSKAILAEQTPGFGVLLDMRKLKPLPGDALHDLREAQLLFQTTGMVRSAVIVDGALLRMHLMKMAKQLDIYNWERYIDASAVGDWEQTAIDWIEQAIDPDLSFAARASCP